MVKERSVSINWQRAWVSPEALELEGPTNPTGTTQIHLTSRECSQCQV